jgi:hypothetical protein
MNCDDYYEIGKKIEQELLDIIVKMENHEYNNHLLVLKRCDYANGLLNELERICEVLYLQSKGQYDGNQYSDWKNKIDRLKDVHKLYYL